MNDNASALSPTRRNEPTAYRPRLAYYHANAKGTGCAVEFELYPASGATAGAIWVRAANQMSIGDRRAPVPIYPRFDWENRLCVKLDFSDLCQMLQVFRGECEAVGEGRGLYHVSPKSNTRIVLRHQLEPFAGYSLEIYRTPRDGGEDRSARILFNPSEALGLCESIAGSMSVLAFGIPQADPVGTAVAEGARNEAAA